MYEIVWLAAAGALGQLVRASYSLASALKAGEKFDSLRFFGTLVGGVVMGALGGIMLGGDIKNAFLMGFTGMDILEGANKLVRK